MIFAIVLSALGSSSPSIINAEREYAELAQRVGQWTAFRAKAAADAVMFVPEPVDANSWLKGRQDPAVSVKWQPAAAFLSCDEKVGATTGPWERAANVGYFTTVWDRSGATWRWKVDFGDRLKKAPPAAPTEVPVRRASCKRAKLSLLPKSGAREKSGAGGSPDHTLAWSWLVNEDGRREMLIYLWNGKSYDRVIDRTAFAAH